ncbi:predicted protein [Verticillium alfalfae VaMs.102]|uniref:Predicted protein n=1 Tax=Verticillium alfalfae (strain VaMs.102 / ATCC MYA-4576 / FGSC 10136) TaxID=526221 RepID=C9SHY0_VERA1|nr:predicted protein [Verticillium alfalfae VaMs.102]EEY18553.1 predicted protein [Verticillium alfalfae VaMs.102]
MLTFLREHNYNVSKHITSNLLMAVMVLCTSVFTCGGELGVYFTPRSRIDFLEELRRLHAGSRLAWALNCPNWTMATWRQLCDIDQLNSRLSSRNTSPHHLRLSLWATQIERLRA